jgi:serine protease Do
MKYFLKKKWWQPGLAVLLFSLVTLDADQRHAFAFWPSTNNQSETELLSKSAHVFNDLAKRTTPAVVSITTLKALPADSAIAEEMEGGLGGVPLPFGNPRRSAPMPGLNSSGNKSIRRVVGLGSGIIIRADGTILTNSHVVDHAERIQVTLADNAEPLGSNDKNKYPAPLVGIDPKTDLAVIKLDQPPRILPTLAFGDSDGLKVGDWAIAVGSPYGLKHTVTFGIISATGRAQMGMLDTEDFIQTDAAINPGSSGGPLLDAAGLVVGVNTAIYSQGGGFSGIGFAVPAKIAHEVSDQLIAQGRVIRGWIGISAQDLDSDLASHFHTSSQVGALVSDVFAIGPAHEAHILPGDVILHFNHQNVASAAQLKSLVGKSQVGSLIPVDVSREGTTQTLSVHVLEAPNPANELPPTQLAGQVGTTHDHSMGLAVEEIPAELNSFLRLPSRTGAIIVSVNPGGPGFDAGLSPGDVILSVDDRPIHGVRDFNKSSAAMKGTVVLYVQHGPADKAYVPVKIEG